ncbi:hypothetical protein KAW96_02935 [candidate division WOR-3 bacterium]|nr:hypothetical protein [candidate division WOR-3 bacterium]
MDYFLSSRKILYAFKIPFESASSIEKGINYIKHMDTNLYLVDIEFMYIRACFTAGLSWWSYKST